jgi:hypothetical protein
VSRPLQRLYQVRSGDAEGVGHGFHREPA